MMNNPIFLSPPNTEYLNLNQDQYHQEDPQQQLLTTSSPFCQSLACDQLKASEDLFHNAESPSYGAQMSTTANYYGSYNNHDLFIFKHQEDHEPKNLCGSGVINSNNIPKIDPIGGSRITSSSQTLDQSPYVGINNETNGNNNVIRVCSHCNTSKTPLWRSGPQGPKSLCNACGIRQRKARKAAIEATAAAAINSSCEISSSTFTKTFKIINKDKKQSRATTNKKQTSFSKEQANQLADSDQTNCSSKRQLRFEEFAVNLLSKNAALQPMFPQDVWEGALLLMALSYGLTDHQC